MNAEARHNARYPNAIVPMSPVLSSATLSLTRDKRQTSILSCQYSREVTSGRAAIALALESSDIKANDEVLIPAFHCESMVSPVRWRKATPVFFRITKNAEIDLDDITRKITPRTKAIIVTHYFGFLQDLSGIRALCDEKGIVLIEDCAHAFFGTRNGKPVGSIGDYAIASSMKFFPCYDGGILASNLVPLNAINLTGFSTLFHLKSFFNIIERAISFGRLGWFGRALKALISFKQLIWGYIKKKRPQHVSQGPSASDGGYGFESSWVHSSTSKPSSFIVNNADQKRIVEARRENYLRYLEALKGLQGATPLFDNLPEGYVPLVFPLYVKNPVQPFESLKQKAVPIWRFGEYLDPAVDETLDPNSVDFSNHVFQFPCHQELKEEEIDWIIQQIKETIQ